MDPSFPRLMPNFAHGTAGVADFFRGLASVTGEASHIAFLERVMTALMSKAATGDGGMSWLQAEHRTRPEFLVAQTGLMQGAAGIGLVYLRTQAGKIGYKPIIRLPDSAF